MAQQKTMEKLKAPPNADKVIEVEEVPEERKKEEKQLWIHNMGAFVRACKRLTFREKAFNLVRIKRDKFLYNTDKKDKIWQERKGRDELKVTKINPHRVQMFSLNEVWKLVQSRLIALNIMDDPDIASEESGSDSSEVEDTVDFCNFAESRIAGLFKGKKGKEKGQKSMDQIMKRNDLILMKKIVKKVAEHENWIVSKSSDEEMKADIRALFNLNDEVNKTFKEKDEVIEGVKEVIEEKHGEFLEFKDVYFKEFMDEFANNVVQDVLKTVNQTHDEMMTKDRVEKLLKQTVKQVSEDRRQSIQNLESLLSE